MKSDRDTPDTGERVRVLRGVLPPHDHGAPGPQRELQRGAELEGLAAGGGEALLLELGERRFSGHGAERGQLVGAFQAAPPADPTTMGYFAFGGPAWLDAALRRKQIVTDCSVMFARQGKLL
mgnify:CR=1 FL=1